MYSACAVYHAWLFGLADSTGQKLVKRSRGFLSNRDHVWWIVVASLMCLQCWNVQGGKATDPFDKIWDSKKDNAACYISTCIYMYTIYLHIQGPMHLEQASVQDLLAYVSKAAAKTSPSLSGSWASGDEEHAEYKSVLACITSYLRSYWSVAPCHLLIALIPCAKRGWPLCSSARKMLLPYCMPLLVFFIWYMSLMFLCGVLCQTR